MMNNRAFYARSFCSGRGIEIGALHFPVRLEPPTRVRYVDRMPTPDLKAHYKELADKELVQVDIVDDGETLATLPDGQEDFVIACQFIEHCQNPVRALVNMLRVIKNERFILLTVPDKRQTFDKDRPLTPNQHILDECLHGTTATARDHYREYVRLVNRKPEEEVEARVDDHLRNKTSIHWHVWDPDSFLEFLIFAKRRFQLPFEIWSATMNGNELMLALRKKVG